MKRPIIVPAQIRAARAMLEWSQEDLAEKSSVSLSTVRDVESQRRPLDTAAAAEIHRALENAGLIFIPGAALTGLPTSVAPSGTRAIRSRAGVSFSTP